MDWEKVEKKLRWQIERCKQHEDFLNEVDVESMPIRTTVLVLTAIADALKVGMESQRGNE